MDTDITYFAKTNFRNGNRVFGIRQADRLLHTYVVGKTGTGKSTLLKTLLLDDIFAGRGTCLLDPHGDLAREVVSLVPAHRQADLVHFNIPDPELALRYNPLKRVSPEKRSLVASGILETFEKLWHDAWGVKLEHILRYCLLTLLDQPRASLNDIPKLLLDSAFRRNALRHLADESAKAFWKRGFPEYTKYDLLPVLNKVGGMLAHPVIRRVLIENEEEVSLRRAMDERRIVIVNLSKGHLGGDVSKILGALFVTSIGAAAMSRADTPEAERVPFFLAVDEFQNYVSLSLVNMFSELRKFRVGICAAHQYLNQLDTKIRHAVLGNAGTVVCFRLGSDDAFAMAREMMPVFEPEDFVRLPNYHVYLKLMIDGVPSRPFSATTFIP